MYPATYGPNVFLLITVLFDRDFHTTFMVLEIPKVPCTAEHSLGGASRLGE
jgi:hypothetical protein